MISQAGHVARDLGCAACEEGCEEREVARRDHSDTGLGRPAFDLREVVGSQAARADDDGSAPIERSHDVVLHGLRGGVVDDDVRLCRIQRLAHRAEDRHPELLVGRPRPGARDPGDELEVVRSADGFG